MEIRNPRRKIKCTTTLARSNLDWEFKQIQILNFNNQGCFDAQNLLYTEIYVMISNTGIYMIISSKLACQLAWKLKGTEQICLLLPREKCMHGNSCQSQPKGFCLGQETMPEESK